MNARRSEVDRIADRLDEIDLALTLAAEGSHPLPMGAKDALLAEQATLRAQLAVARKIAGKAQS